MDFRNFPICVASGDLFSEQKCILNHRESIVLVLNFSKNKKLSKNIKFQESYDVTKLVVFRKNLEIPRFSYIEFWILLPKLLQTLKNPLKVQKVFSIILLHVVTIRKTIWHA